MSGKAINIIVDVYGGMVRAVRAVDLPEGLHVMVVILDHDKEGGKPARTEYDFGPPVLQ